MSKVVRFEVPKEVKGKKFEHEYLTTAQQVLRELTVLRLFEQGKVSTGYAAKLLCLTRYQFIDLMARHRVPLWNYSKEELAREFQAAVDLSRSLIGGQRRRTRRCS
jgi:predicted HTH domain antitoxin